MTDRMDDLLYAIGAEENSRLDADAAFSQLLAEKHRLDARRRRTARAAAAAAVLVAAVGISSLLLNGALMGAEAPMAKEEEAAEAGEAPMGQAVNQEQAALDLETADEEKPAEEAPAPEAPPYIIGGCGTGDACDSDGAEDMGFIMEASEVTEPGTPREGFLDELRAQGFTAEKLSWEEEGPGPGEAWLLKTGEYALWNTGVGLYRITPSGEPSLEGLRKAIAGACE